MASNKVLDGDGLDALIERRRQQLGEADRREEDVFMETTRREEAKKRERNRWEWVRFFEGMSRTLRSRADEYEERARKLIESRSSE